MESPQGIITLPEEEGIDIKKYIFLVLSHWWWFAITLFVSLTIAYLVNRYAQNVYSVNSSIIIGEQQSAAGSVESMLDELSRVRNRNRKAVVENEITILKSYKLARLSLEELDFGVTYTAVGRRSIAETQLYLSSPFVVVPDSATQQKGTGRMDVTLLSSQKYKLSLGDKLEKTYFFGETVKLGESVFTLYLRDASNYVHDRQHSNKYFFVVNNLNKMALGYSRRLNVTVNDDKGSILFLSMTGFVPQQLADYLNKLGEIYVRANLESKNLTSENTMRFIDDQLQGVVDSLEVTGLRLQNFRSANKVMDLSQEANFLFGQVQSLQSEKVTLDMNDRYFRYLLEYIDNKTDFSDVVAPSVIGIHDQLLNSLVASLNEQNMKKRTLEFSLQADSPQNLQLASQIADTRKVLRENLQNLVESNRLAMQALEERIARIDTQVQKLPGTERQLINIQRKFTINDQIYTFLLQKRAEAGITKASNNSDHKPLDVARSENVVMVKPKTSANYMLALALGGGMPLSLLLIIGFFNTRITDRRTLETNLRVPVMGNIGHFDEGGELPVYEKPGSSLAESFRAMRTNLQYLLKEPGEKVIAVTSAVSGEGKTFCSVNLATIFAMAGRKTLLLSLDLRRPKIHKVFNLTNETGLSTYLINRNSYEEVINATNIANLWVATSGPIPPNPAELIDSARMQQFLEQAKKEYDFIIIDTPPVAIVSDTMTLKHLIDAFLFVIRHNYSDRQVIDLINHIAKTRSIKNVGVVVNDIQLKGYYGYSYRYEYGYGYTYSYRHNYYDEEIVSKSFFRDLFRKKT